MMLTEEISVCVIKRCSLANIQGNTEIERGKMGIWDCSFSGDG